MPRPTLALPVPRHACHGCGGSCQGVTVRPLPDEIPGLRETAAALGVDDPFVDGTLRQVDGRCVFLADDQRCRIHATHGAAAKPHVCRQFPLVVVHAEGGARIGVDPSCFHAWRSWRDGPEPPEDTVLHGVPRERPAGEQQAEATLLSLLAAVPTPELALAQLSAPGIAARWSALLRRQDPDVLLPRTPGPRARAAVARLLDAPADPTGWGPLDPDLAAYTLNATRGFIALRMGHSQLRAIGSTLLMLLGALAATWQETEPEAYGELLAGWTRSLRVPPFWSTVISGPDVLQALIGGPQRPGVS